MKFIILQNDLIAIVDDDKIEYLSKFNWRGIKKGNTWYAVRQEGHHDARKTIYMHHQLLKPENDKVCDHVNGCGLDNRIENLRLCTRKQNSYNIRMSKKNTTGYKGVSFDRRFNKYVAYIGSQKTRKYLGSFNDVKSAAAAYNAEAIRRHGEFARLNEIR